MDKDCDGLRDGMDVRVEDGLCSGETLTGTDGRCWRLVGPVGSGSCCTVWQVHPDGQPLYKAALKVYHLGELYAAAASREKLLLHLVHTVKGRFPYIVETLDSFTHNGHACLIQTYLEGDVRHLVLRNLGLPLSAAVIKLLLTHILKGLLMLHSVGFVHGDLKPENLLWNPQQSTLTIVDYGLSFHVKDEVIGELQSPGYRAPEVQTWNNHIHPKDNTNTSQVYQHQPQTNFSFKEASQYCPMSAHQSNIPNIGRDMPQPIQNDKIKINMSPHKHKKSHRTVHTSADSGVSDSVDSGRHMTHISADAVGVGNLNNQTPTDITHPDTSADMWSVGCIILDLIIGKKFFTAKERATFDLHSQKGLQCTQSYMERMVRDVAQRQYEQFENEADHQALVLLADLCLSLLQVDPSKRLSAKDALHHQFFSCNPCLSHQDLLLLPSRVLRLCSADGNNSYQSHETRDILEELQQVSQEFGKVVEVALSNSVVYIVYGVWTSAVAACNGLVGMKFKGHYFTVSYCPLELYQQERTTAAVRQ